MGRSIDAADRLSRSELIARGVSGGVYRTKDPKVVVKVIVNVKLGVEEIGMLRALSHPNIIRIIDHDTSSEENGQLTVSIWFPRIQYHLGEYLKKPRPVHVTLSHAAQLLRALRYIHEDKQLMHRDIKPGNVLVEPGPEQWGEARILLADFGNAAWIDPERCYTAPVSAWSYSAPETILRQHRASPGKAMYDERVDMFAFGCVFYEMLTRGGKGKLFGDISSEEEAHARHSIVMEKMDNVETHLRGFLINVELANILIGCIRPDFHERMNASTALVHIENAQSAYSREAERPVMCRDLERVFRHAH